LRRQSESVRGSGSFSNMHIRRRRLPFRVVRSMLMNGVLAGRVRILGGTGAGVSLE
jgi:hypothetical protein